MAIYRSDQASVTFVTEANPGAYPENSALETPVDVGASAATRTSKAGVDHAAGAKTMQLSGTFAHTGLVGNGRCLVSVGNDDASGGPREVRKLVDGFGTDTITFDHPLAFSHNASCEIKGMVIAAAANDSLTLPVIPAATNVAPFQAGNLITHLPGVYDAVDVPDPEQAFEPYYLLGGQNRNFYSAYPGQESLNGSIGGMVLLNATPLRFPLGKMISLPTASTVTGWKVGTTATANGASKGAVNVNVFHSSSTAAIPINTLILFGSDDGVANASSPTGGEVDASTFSTLPNSTYEIRRLMRDSAGQAGTAGVLHLDSPLQFAHPPNELISTVTATGPFYHTIWETNALDSITMNVNVMDSSETSANTWQRRYVGGKVGGMTMSAEEGGLLNVGWDSMMFLDMIHNMKNHPDLPSSGSEMYMPRYGAMQDIGPTNVGFASSADGVTVTSTRPSTAPYYFSQGTVKMFGNDPSAGAAALTLGRIRSFSISVANSEEPRYYISNQLEGKRGPTEILEQRREYSMTATIATDDTASVSADTRNVFKELLLAGDYRATGTSGLRGFAIELTFARSTDDTITIRIPGETFGNNANSTHVASSTGGEQGAFIRSAAHNIGDSNPLEAEVDILFRSMIINVKDTEPIYP